MVMETGRMNDWLNNQAKKLQGAYKDRMKDAIYPRFMEEMATKVFTEREQTVNAMRSLAATTENSPFEQLNLNMGWAQSYTQRRFTGRVDITIEMAEFQMANMMATLLNYLRLAPQDTREIIAATYLEYGDTALASVPFVGGRPLINSIGGDGLTLFNTAHTFRSDSTRTWANLAATYVDLTEAGVIAVYNDVAGWKDEYGHPFGIAPQDIIYPVNKTSQYLKVRKSLLEPGSAQNAINVTNDLFKGGGTQSRWLTSTADWYVRTSADAETFGLKYYIGIRDRTYRGKDPNTQADYIGVIYMCADGANELRRIYAIKQ